MTPFASSIFQRTYSINETETWGQCAARVAKAIAFNETQEEEFRQIITDRQFIPGGRYLYTAGRPILQCSNCFGFVAQDSREGWANLLHSVTMCLSMGGGLGVNYSSLRPYGTPIKRMGGHSSGPLALMQMVNEVGRHVMAGGKRRSALWAGLHWKHDDIEDFIVMKDWNEDYRALKAKNFEFPAPMDMTNISVLIDDEYIERLRAGDEQVVRLNNLITLHMLKHGEPGFINISETTRDDDLAITRNACCESTLHHGDSCNLGSIVMPRIKDLDDLERVTRLAIQFLYNGSLRCDYPTEEISKVVAKNRRLGLGIMGMHEWMMLQGGGKYAWTEAADKWFMTWANTCDDEAEVYSSKVGGETPIATRAIAPTGTISIIAETTSGIEPIYCTAYKRRYINHDKHLAQFVIDPTAKRLMDMGFDPAQIEDTYTLSSDLHRRLNVQANVQKYTDQAISNTVNVPQFGTSWNTSVSYFTDALKSFLPHLKGLTIYPEGARAGQPLTRVAISEATGKEGVVYEEEGERCANGVCGL